MSMLGAQLDDLLALAARLRATSSDIAEVQQRATAATTGMADEMRAAAQRAMSDIGTTMDSLRSSVSASTARADATVWNGANAARFLDAQHDLDRALGAGETATKQAFSDFTASIARMADGIETYVQGLRVSLDAAHSAALSMAGAVEQQHQRLDEAMNHGLAVR